MVERDGHALFALLTDPEIHVFTGGRPPASADDVRERIRRRESRRSPAGDELWLNWTLRLRQTQSVVGYLQAGVTQGKADLAWVVGVPFQRRATPLRQVEGSCDGFATTLVCMKSVPIFTWTTSPRTGWLELSDSARAESAPTKERKSGGPAFGDSR